jgi:hypothetical protein
MMMLVMLEDEDGYVQEPHRVWCRHMHRSQQQGLLRAAMEGAAEQLLAAKHILAIPCLLSLACELTA